MRLKINKACDLSSISVLPPHSRRSNALTTGQQAPQLRSQPSQQSFSQGLSSQHGMYSQLSQNSFDEVVTNEQRFSSQDRENSIKKNSFFPPLSYSREDCQLALSKSSTSLTQRWKPTPLPDSKCQVGEELDRRLGTIENSLNKFGKILDSLHSDILQLNKGMKQISLDVEGIWQKMLVNSSSLQSMNKDHDDMKATLDGGFKLISNQLKKDAYQERLNEISNVLSSLEKQVQASQLKLKNDFISTFTQEIKAMVCTLKNPLQKFPPHSIQSPESTACLDVPQQKRHRCKIQSASPNVCIRATTVQKEEVGRWKSVKVGKTFCTGSVAKKDDPKKVIPFSEQRLVLEREYRVIVDSDEEIERSFSCLIEEKKTGEDVRYYSIEDAKEESARILRKARRQKRKYCNPIIIN
ncbi:putative recombination initiation defects 3 isoform X2 [Benincasa hispida]|uniref:putative recombination initiation defects 3 isoform X2 n=1 Tax=Benincasa hispida TaxID=102211 RepID=UPI001900243C|nr:putative recombination initiation defects 3 isoform X2 [Benincasa hispida]